MRYLSLLFTLMTACSCTIDNRPYVANKYQGTIIRHEATAVEDNKPHAFSIGLMVDGETKLFESNSGDRRFHRDNWLELRRVFILHKMGDIVTITWFEREEHKKEE